MRNNSGVPKQCSGCGGFDVKGHRCPTIKPVKPTADQLIERLERLGYDWDIGYTSRLRECRIWRWPSVVGRYRPGEIKSLADMLMGAMDKAEIGFNDGEYDEVER